MKIKAIRCKKCKDIIFSRARHDCHYCSCGETFVDGGFNYLRVGFKTAQPENITIDLPVTKKELYDDWNYRTDKYGVIKNKKGN